MLLYESPHRLIKTLESLLEVWGDRRIVLARELTKRYEEMARGRFTIAWLGCRSIRRWVNIASLWKGHIPTK